MIARRSAMFHASVCCHFTVIHLHAHAFDRRVTYSQRACMCCLDTRPTGIYSHVRAARFEQNSVRRRCMISGGTQVRSRVVSGIRIFGLARRPIKGPTDSRDNDPLSGIDLPDRHMHVAALLPIVCGLQR